MWDGIGETMEGGAGSTKLAIEGDALARFATCEGARGEPSGPVPYGSLDTMVSRTGS